MPLKPLLITIEPLLCLIAAVCLLPFVGYLRSAIDTKKPAYLLSPENFTAAWLKENNWLSRFSVFFIAFVFLFNLFAWTVYGVTSIVDFVVFLFRMMWWLVLWIWNEVLHPTVFAFVKLLWHYTVVIAWKFFKLSLSLVGEALKIDAVFFAFKKLLLFFGVSSVLLLAYLLISNIIVLIVGLLLIFYLLQYSAFSTVAHIREQNYDSYQIFPNIRIVALWMLVSAFSTGIIVALKMYSGMFVIAGLGVTLSQILVPVSILTSVAFLLSTLYLPAFIEDTGADFQLQDFLKAILLRLPKLIAAQPFLIFGLLLAGIIPLIIASLLNVGITQTTGKDMRQWARDITLIGNHIPTYKSNAKTVEYMKVLQKTAAIKNDSLTKVYDKQIAKANNELKATYKLKATILDNQIHTFAGNAYVGEMQSFSIPELPGCAEYEWIIKNTTNNAVVAKIVVNAYEGSGTPQSYVIYYRWAKAGNYSVSLTPRNTCGTSGTLDLSVTVVDNPKYLPEITKPSGKISICSSEEVVYTARPGFSQYTWSMPEGAQIVKNNKESSQITVKWGETSGPLRVKGTDKDGRESNWAGIYVKVTTVPGKTVKEQPDVPDEMPQQFNLLHPAYYISREIADDSIAVKTAYLENCKRAKLQGMADISGQLNNLTASVEEYTQDSKDQISKLEAELLATIGLVLFLSIALCSIWLFVIAFQYDLFNYEQDGQHYWSELHDSLKAKNPNQPLLGLFVLIVLVVLGGLIVYKIFILKNVLSYLLTVLLK